jgi:outer membrane protein assembly factor BamB
MNRRFFASMMGVSAVRGADWLQFRGPNASGVTTAKNLPVEFGPQKNLAWRTVLPLGNSSPVLAGERVFVTGVEDEKLMTFCLDRASGKTLWRREAPRARKQHLHKFNTPASPSPVSDGTNVYSFFTDYGLVSYGPDGNERWKVAMGPFENPMGMGGSPVLAEGILVLPCDSESGSYIVGIEARTGKQLWKTERPEHTRGFSTPVLCRPANGPLQAILAGSYQMNSYDVKTGAEVWSFRGLTWQVKPTPILSADQQTVYVLGWASGSDTGSQESVPEFDEVLKLWDKDSDKRLSKEEVTDAKMRKQWDALDVDNDGFLGARDWKLHQYKSTAVNTFQAVRIGANPRGDLSATARTWAYTKSLPNVPSPLLYENVLYLMKEGGILTTVNPHDGSVLKQGRLAGALAQYFASPVAADGKVYVVSQTGNVVVLKAGKEWEVMQVNSLEEECFATPALADGKIYVRTRAALYCFSNA